MIIFLGILVIAALGGLSFVLLKGLGIAAAVIIGIILLLALIGLVRVVKKPPAA